MGWDFLLTPTSSTLYIILYYLYGSPEAILSSHLLLNSACWISHLGWRVKKGNEVVNMYTLFLVVKLEYFKTGFDR